LRRVSQLSKGWVYNVQINWKKLSQIALVLGVTLISVRAFATTYYIDYSSGNDASNGTSKSAPWQHLPGMNGATGVALAHTLAPGDNMILKGGVTWPAAAFPEHEEYRGSANSGGATGCTGSGCIYIGVDQTWYSGGSWTRPIFNEQGNQPGCTYGTGCGVQVDIYGGYIILDNIEFTGFADLSDAPGSIFIVTSRCEHCEFKNLYFHGWSHGGSATQDDGIIFGGSAGCPADNTVSIHDNVADGSDTSKDMMMFTKSNVMVYNNYVTYMHNGLVGTNQYVFQNSFVHINGTFGTLHGNVVESTGCQLILWNNYTNDVSGGSNIFNGPVDGSVDYDFNNVLVEPPGSATIPIQIDNNELHSGVGSGIYVFNNTIQEPAGYNENPINGPSRTGYPNLPFMTVYNNHLIADSPAVDFKLVTTPIQSNNLETSNATAASSGYTLSQVFQLLPTSNSSPTVGAGVNISSSVCSLLSDAPPATPYSDCLNDSAVGVGYNTGNHTVIVPNRVPTSRGSVWDIGAYEFGGGGSSSQSRPAPPAGLTATVQ
jgi:hypothetical protein